MGHRFQVFLIARLGSPSGSFRYRCVGAFHHQMCFAELPIRALHRFFALLNQPENAATVTAELRWLDVGYRLGREDEVDEPATPCPYTLSLLAIAWTTDLEYQTYISGNSVANGLMDARDGCWHRGQ